MRNETCPFCGETDWDNEAMIARHLAWHDMRGDEIQMPIMKPFEVKVTLTAVKTYTIDPAAYGARTEADAMEMDRAAVAEDPVLILENDALEFEVKVERVTP